MPDTIFSPFSKKAITWKVSIIFVAQLGAAACSGHEAERIARAHEYEDRAYALIRSGIGANKKSELRVATLSGEVKCASGAVVLNPVTGRERPDRWFILDDERLSVFATETARFTSLARACLHKQMALDKKLGREAIPVE